MEFRRFLTNVILIPAMVIRRARSITVRLLGYQPSLDRLFSRTRHEHSDTGVDTLSTAA